HWRSHVVDRRAFIKQSAVLAGMVAAGSRLTAQAPGGNGGVAPLRILILGGTGFIGPHLVRHAVARGHRVTIFTRGRRTADLPAGVERLVGDRNGQLDALRGRRWDAVIDDSATNPEWVRQSTALLKDSVGRYLFTSSTGVYYPYLTRGVDESTPVRTEADDPKDGSATFGVAKARCERVAQDAFGARALVVRPTYIVGPGDTTDRFPYWPVRLARGGETLAPGRRDDAVQIVDVRDLAEFMVTLVEQERSGIYNAAGPAQPLTFGRFLEQAAAAVGSTSRFVWIDDYAFLEQQGITEAIPWVMLKGNDVGHTHVRNGRAIAAGLGFRPLADTVRDTLAWWPTVPEARRNAPRFAIRPEQEVAAIAAWKARGGR
ncbi:MAG: NAD-dependent epimerase/dehydratase family protein, partial [Gemmatirosa sp.]